MPFRIFAAEAPQNTLVRNVLAGSRALVVLFVGSGVAAIVGQITGIEWLAAPVEGWRAMGITSAVASIALGVALWSRISARRYVALSGASLALGISIMILISRALGFAMYANSPLPSVVLIAISAIGFLSGVLQPRNDVEKITLGIAGLALVALAVTVTFAHAIGIFDIKGGDELPGSSLQLTINAILLGICFVSLVWASGIKDLELPPWLPVATGLASLITVMSLWSALTERERQQQLQGAGQAATTEARLILREIQSHALSLKRAANWSIAGTTAQQEENDFYSLARDIPSLKEIYRLGVSGTRIAQFPQTTDASAVGTLWRAYVQLNQGQPDTTIFLPLDSASRDFVIFAPVCSGTTCTGAVAGVVRSPVLFNSLLSDTLNSFRFAIAGPHGQIEGTAPFVRTMSTAQREVRVGHVSWTLFATPGSSVTDRESNLPGTVLFMGLVMTLLLPITIQLGRYAWEGSRDRERTRLSKALDRATDGIWELDLVTGTSVRSPSLWRHLQYPPEAVPPNVEEWTALIHPDDRSAVYHAMSRHLAGESESYETEYRVRANNGEWHVVVDRGRVVDRTPSGEPARLLGISADVTEARATSKARDESEQRVRALFNSSFQFLILLDAECRIIEINRVALDYLKEGRDVVLNKLCWETLWWADNPQAQTALRNACQIALAGQTKTWEQMFEQSERAPLTFEISLKPIRSGDERSSQMILEGRDITERRRTEAWLKEVDTLTTMGRVAARVAHEINNPLAGIQNAFLLIKDAVPSDHRYFPYVGSIEREISRISNVTRQLYETYRPEQDNTGTASIQLIVTDAVAFLEQVNRSRSFQIVTDLTRVPSAVPVPAAILRQIVYNLVQNAIDASPKEGVVQVIGEAKASSVELRVKDQGPGVPDALRERIFEPFFSTKEKEMKTSGMGLGLALVKRTVVAAGGTIVVNTLPEGGSEFLVVLPLENNEAEAERDEQQHGKNPSR